MRKKKQTQEVVTSEGLVRRQDDGSFIVKVRGATHMRGMDQVVCENPDAADADQIFSRVFRRKPIYLPEEYDRAHAEILRGTDVVVLALNGYSALSPQKCREYGVKPGAYEAACYSIFDGAIDGLLKAYRGIDIRIAHGASGMGVDGVQLKVAKHRNLKQLGHSCPKFMFYVEDDEVPVYVADSQLAYADRFVDSLDILIAANGREQAFRHDILAVFSKLKHMIPINVLKAISDNGGPPAIGPDNKIEDAVAAYETRIHAASRMVVTGGDPFVDAKAHALEQTRAIARNLISPERAFGSLPMIDAA